MKDVTFLARRYDTIKYYAKAILQHFPRSPSFPAQHSDRVLGQDFLPDFFFHPQCLLRLSYQIATHHRFPCPTPSLPYERRRRHTITHLHTQRSFFFSDVSILENKNIEKNANARGSITQDKTYTHDFHPSTNRRCRPLHNVTGLQWKLPKHVLGKPATPHRGWNGAILSPVTSLQHTRTQIRDSEGKISDQTERWWCLRTTANSRRRH